MRFVSPRKRSKFCQWAIQIMCAVNKLNFFATFFLRSATKAIRDGAIVFGWLRQSKWTQPTQLRDMFHIEAVSPNKFHKNIAFWSCKTRDSKQCASVSPRKRSKFCQWTTQIMCAVNKLNFFATFFFAQRNQGNPRWGNRVWSIAPVKMNSADAIAWHVPYWGSFTKQIQ